MKHCEQCKSRMRCAACAGTGLRLTTASEGTGVWASCAKCWGTGLVHDPKRHPEPARA